MEIQADEVSWPKKPLSELCDEITVGFVGSITRHYVEHGVPFLRSKDVKPYRIQLSELIHISEDFHMRISKSRLRPGDVVIVRTGAPGTAARIPAAIKEANCADLVIARPSRRLDGTFLVYYLNYAAKSHVSQFAVGAVQQHLNVGAVKSLRVPFPPMSEQKAIASILGSLDDKIDLNRRMNETLESMARALYKSWFVDFDPVVAKAAGKRPFGMDDATAALFPDRFVDSELGPIPEGWDAGAVGAIAEFPRETVQPSDVDPETPYVGLEHMPRRSIFLVESGRAQNVSSGKLAFREGDLLFGKLRAYFHKVIVAPGSGVCSTDIVVARSLRPEDAPYLWFTLFTDQFVDYATRVSGGTRMPRVKWQDMSRFPIALPSDYVRRAFQQQVGNLVELGQHNVDESQTLAHLRDLLLPKLLSGEIRVRDAEKIAQEVV